MRPPVPPRLVIVDDDPAVRHALAFALEIAGFRVSAYADAEAALQAADSEWRCLILDQRLPGMSGLELLARLRAGGLAAPALLITTNPARDLRARAFAAGAEIIEKPLLDDALVRRVARLVSSAP